MQIDITKIRAKSFKTLANEQETKKDKFSISNFLASNITSSSAKIRFDFSQHQLKDNLKKEFEIIFSNNINHKTSIYSIGDDFLEFDLSNLSSNTNYELMSVKLNGIDLDVSKINNKNFTTLNNQSTPPIQEQKTNVSNINFLEKTHNSSVVDIQLSDQITNNDTLTLEITEENTNQKSIFNEFSILSNNKVKFNLTSLKPNTSYTISKVVFKNKEVLINSNLTKTFRTNQQPTQPSKPDNFVISNLNIKNTRNNTSQVEVIFSSFILSDNNQKSFRIQLTNNSLGDSTNNSIFFNTNKYIVNDNKVIFLLDNLIPNSNYEIQSISLNNNNLNLPTNINKTFKTTNKATQIPNNLIISAKDTIATLNLSFNNSGFRLL